jgi:hypothetical protein
MTYMKQDRRNIQVDGGTHAEIVELAHEEQRSIADQVRRMLREYKRQRNGERPCPQYTPISEPGQGVGR